MRLRLKNFLAGLAVLLAAGPTALAQGAEVATYRHHVVFLLDTSQSMFRPGRPEAFEDAVRRQIPSLLSDPGAASLGLSLLGPERDLSSAFTFGFYWRTPLFAPEDGRSQFLTEIWREENDSSVSDLEGYLERPGAEGTGYSSAFPLAVKALKDGSQDKGGPTHAFERTFLVMITDREANTSRGSLDELKGLHGRAVEETRFDSKDGEADRSRVASWLRQLNDLYSLSPVTTADGAEDFDLGRGLKLLIRELRPHRLTGIDALLAVRPERETELARQAGGSYEGRLRAAPYRSQPDDEVSYRLVSVGWQLPGEEGFTALPLPENGQPAEVVVSLRSAEVAEARARIRLEFLRKDPVYGRALQSFEETIRFRAEPTAWVLGLFPVTDGMMRLLPGTSQEGVATLMAFLVILCIVLAVLALLYWLLFPAPKAWAEWRPTGGDGSLKAVLVDFSSTESGQGESHPVVPGELYFTNQAQRLRWVPGLATLLRRLRVERAFSVRVEAELAAPQAVVLGDVPAVGLTPEVRPLHRVERVRHGNNLIVALQPSAFADYQGNWSDLAETELRLVIGSGKSRGTQQVCVPLRLRFRPESPEIEAKIRPARRDQPTGSAGDRPWPREFAGRIVEEWISLPHWRIDPSEKPASLWTLAVRSAAHRRCALPRSARLHLSLVKRATGELIPGALLLGPPKGHGVTAVRIESHAGEPAWQVDNIRGAQGGKWAALLPITMDFEKIPAPGVAGEDYLVEVHLEPAPGQDWRPLTLRHGLRLGPDPRQPAFRLRTSVLERDPAGELAWRDWELPPEGAALKLLRTAPLLFLPGPQKETESVLRLKMDNVARAGEGSVTIELDPVIELKPEAPEEASFEPRFHENRLALLELVAPGVDGESLHELPKELRWEIPSEAPASSRPLVLELRFNPQAIQSFDRQVRRVRYLCSFSLRVSIRRDPKQEPEQRRFALQVSLTVERNAGDHTLAIDFGTSAVVAAFEQSLQNVKDRGGLRFSTATLSLQQRYEDLLADPARRNEKAQEAALPNTERGTPFIPSHLVWKKKAEQEEERKAIEGDPAWPAESKKKAQRELLLGGPGFVHLPATVDRLRTEPYQAVHYLKSLILRGDESLPEPKEAAPGRTWLGQDGTECAESPPVDGIIESAYRNLVECYIEPMLQAEGLDLALDHVVLAFPNNFTVGHLDRLRRVLRQAFGDRFQFEFLSESNAVAVYIAFLGERLLPKAAFERDEQCLLIYDIGAGTLDLTLVRVSWHGEDRGYGLKGLEVLYRSGLPVAGNRLDVALARALDSKIRALEKKLEERGVHLHYQFPIVAPSAVATKKYAATMLPIQRALHDWKVALSQGDGTGDDLVLTISAAEAEGKILDVEADSGVDLEEELKNLGVGLRSWSNVSGRAIAIPFPAREVLVHPEVRKWLFDVTDGALADFAEVLAEIGVESPIDAVVLSGRTSLFPPLKQSLRHALEANLGALAAEAPVVEMEGAERKEAVALGCLTLRLLRGSGVTLADRDIWARYGVIYQAGRVGEHFHELFGPGLQGEPSDREVEVEGRRRWRRRRRVRLPFTGQLRVAATFSGDPQRDLKDALARAEKFSILHTISAEKVAEVARPRKGGGREVEVEMAIDEHARLEVVLDPDGKRLRVSELSQFSKLGRQEYEWPYAPPPGLPASSTSEDFEPPSVEALAAASAISVVPAASVPKREEQNP